MQNAQERAAILKNVPEADADAQLLQMTDGGKTIGWVAIDIRSSVVRMLAMELEGKLVAQALPAQNIFLADFLMRAAASYGANHGAYRIASHIPPLEPLLRPLGFTGEDGWVATDLIHIVHITQK